MLYMSILKEEIFLNDNYLDIIKKVEKDKTIFWNHIFSRRRKRSKRIDNVNNNYQCYLKFGQEDY